MTLAATDRSDLLKLARASLEEALGSAGAVDRALTGIKITPALHDERAVFVTLHTRATGALRGCIGTLEAREPLYRSVVARAADAGLRDPRFAPLTLPELGGVEIEISALTIPRPVRGPDEIVAGLDGVELERGAHRAVFLPQVATEQGWSVSELLRQLARKAGLAPHEWDGAHLSVFRAEVFAEGRV